jgi:hypothetical protein
MSNVIGNAVGIKDSNKKDLNPSRGAASKANIGESAGDMGSMNNSQYNVGQYQYPSDLFRNNNVYGGNYVIFYINVAEDSRILQGDKEPTIDPSQVPARLRGDLVGNDYNSAQIVAGAAGAPLASAQGVGTVATGAAAGAVAGAKKGIMGVVKGGITGAAAAGGALALQGAANAAAAGVVSIAAGGKMARQQKRLQKAIALHIPNKLNIKYSMDWEAESTAAFQMAATVGTEVLKAIVPGVGSNFTGAAGAAATNIALGGQQGAALSAASGIAANPKKENLFKQVNFRSFSFEYQFFPRNESEAQNILNIIREFKLHMHPEYKDSNNFLFIYPSEFDIFYYNSGVENLNLHRHTSCVLTDLDVDYTPNSQFTSFYNGMPTQINISMTFKELAILTKKEIADKF